MPAYAVSYETSWANDFESFNIVDDHLWTQRRVRRAIEQSRRSNRQWGLAAGCSTQAIQQWAARTRPIHREAAWKLTRAAWRFGVELPPVGMVGYRKGAWSKERRPHAPEAEARRLERLKEAKWTLDQLIVLGTMPDRVVAEHLGKTRNSVAIMRRALGLNVVDLSTWDENRGLSSSLARRCRPGGIVSGPRPRRGVDWRVRR